MLLPNSSTSTLAFHAQKLLSSVKSIEDQNWLSQFETYISAHIDNPSFNIPEMAEEFAMSESSLRRQVKRLTGLSPLRYLQEYRMKYAHYLLESRVYNSVQKVAYAVGYADPRSFTRCFREHYKALPSEYLK